MRLQALAGGLALLTVVTLWRRPLLASHAAGPSETSKCDLAGAGDFCVAIAGLSNALRNPIPTISDLGVLPPPGTPGATDPAVNQTNIDITICRPGYARANRPSYAVSGPFKRRLMKAQHPGERASDYELDHLIPISIGGAPFDKRDLWLQPRHAQANADDKNVLAYVLWRLVCEHRVPLQTAQHAISHDWIQAYATYATSRNVARYHFRHGETAPD